MVVLEESTLAPEFLRSAGLPTLRAVIPQLFPETKVRARSRDELIDKLPPAPWHVAADSFRKAMWKLVAAESGAIHVGIFSNPELDQHNAGTVLQAAHNRWQALSRAADKIETGNMIDSRLTGSGDSTCLEALHLGETEAEIYDPYKNQRSNIDGVPYILKAFRIATVPVISTIRVTAGEPFVTVITFPIHRNATPTREVLGLQVQLEAALSLPFPPVAGIASGVRSLWGDGIEPRRYEVEEGDGTRAHIRRAKGVQNEVSIEVEKQLRGWDFCSGTLFYTKTAVPFRVDARKAVFSFGAKVTRQNAFHVIRSILAAA